MDPSLIAANAIVVAFGILCAVIAYLARKVASKATLSGVVVIGYLFVVVGSVGLPGSALRRLGEAVASHATEDKEEGDPSSDEEWDEDDSAVSEEDNLVLIGSREQIKAFVLDLIAEGRRLAPTQTVEPAVAPAPEPSIHSSAIPRDPFTPSPSVVFSAQGVSTPVAPVRERTLPQEPENGEAVCTQFKLLHGKRGGPGEGMCYAVGCQQGYALPKSWRDGEGWIPCLSFQRLERTGECYFVQDSDGSEHGMRFKDGDWVPCQ